jgi:hypothetical protein
MTASVSLTMVTTIPARRAASAAFSATCPPRAARSPDAAGLRFQTIVRMPARKALGAKVITADRVTAIIVSERLGF